MTSVGGSSPTWLSDGLAVRIPKAFRPLPLEAPPTADESAWPPEKTELVGMMRATWRSAGIVFMGELRRTAPLTSRVSVAVLTIAYATVPGAGRIRSAQGLLAVVGSDSSATARKFRIVEHDAGPCVASLNASVLELAAPGAPAEVRDAIGGEMRCLEALAYVHPLVDDSCLAVTLTTTSAEEWPDYARVFAGVLHSVRFGAEEAG